MLTLSLRVTELLTDAPAETTSAARVQLYASAFGAGTPQIYSGSLLLPAGVRLSDYCNLDDPVLLLQAARPEGVTRSFALAKDALDAIWTQQPLRGGDPGLYLERRPVEVHLQTRLLDVVGTLHLSPGADALEMVLRGTRRYVAVTGARVLVPGVAPRLETGVGVCLVNRAHVVAVEAARKPAA